MQYLTYLVTSTLLGGIAATIIVFLLRGWISQRLKNSIEHVYDLKLQRVLHNYQIDQLRTSLFFEHQRSAFTAILSSIAETKEEWFADGYDSDVGWQECIPVPREKYIKFKKSYYDHQLFLDRDCIFALNLVLEAMSDSFQVDSGDGMPRQRNCEEVYERLDFLQERVRLLFQEKLGIKISQDIMIDLAFLGGIKLLNRFHSREIDLPIRGNLELSDQENAFDSVIKARNNSSELVLKLTELKKYLEKDGFFHEALEKAMYCLDTLGTLKKGRKKVGEKRVLISS